MKTKILMAVGVILILVVAILAGCSTTNSTAPISSVPNQTTTVTSTVSGTSVSGNQPLTLKMDTQQSGIWVNGEGKVSVAPDVATLTLGVYSQKDKVSSAQTEAASAMDSIIKALTSNGIDKKDIQTQNFSIQQVTKWDDKGQVQVVIGYSVTNMVVAKIRNLDKVGTIIDASVTAGGDLIRVNGIDFSREDTTQYYLQARELAMNKAKAKADQMASLSGVKLGKPVYITESTYVPPRTYTTNSYKMDMAGGASVPTTSINPGELDVIVDVQVTYAIE
jgi:uncharacterized protein